jgi:hypothetical protein
MDILERLRLVDITFRWKPLGGGVGTNLDVPAYEIGALFHEAADEIERLQKENDRLREALRVISSIDYRIERLKEWNREVRSKLATDEIGRLRLQNEQLREALEMVRDADDDCHADGLPTIPPLPRAKIDKALEEKE